MYVYLYLLHSFMISVLLCFHVVSLFRSFFRSLFPSLVICSIRFSLVRCMLSLCHYLVMSSFLGVCVRLCMLLDDARSWRRRKKRRWTSTSSAKRPSPSMDSGRRLGEKNKSKRALSRLCFAPANPRTGLLF